MKGRKALQYYVQEFEKLREYDSPSLGRKDAKWEM